MRASHLLRVSNNNNNEIYIAPLSILIKCSRRFKILGNTLHHDKESCTFTSERKCKNERMNEYRYSKREIEQMGLKVALKRR